MSSTKNRNTKYDYLCEKKKDADTLNYNIFKPYGQHEKPRYFKNGPNPSFKANVMSENHVDIESKLRGINSTNLEGPSFDVNPKLNHIPCEILYDKQPIQLPESFVHNLNERPQYIP
jgi:hypothetical protein